MLTLSFQKVFDTHGIIPRKACGVFICSTLVYPSISPKLPPSLITHMFSVAQNGKSEAEELVLSHYVICNDTHETLRFGQVDTDENVLLASRHSHQYSWRSHKSAQVKQPAPHTHTQ